MPEYKRETSSEINTSTAWVAGAFLVFLIPDLSYIFISDVEGIFEKILLLFISIALALAILTQFRKHLRLYVILVYSLTLLFGVISTGLVIFYKARMNVNTMGAILNTNAEEVSEFMSGYKLIAGLIIISILILGYLNFKFVPARLNIAARRLWMTAAVFFVTGSLLFIFVRHESPKSFVKNNLSKNYYPVYCFKSISAYYREEMRIKANVEKASKIHFNAKRTGKCPERNIHILIIGESGRYANWGINGYDRNTSPYLSNTPNLISFADAVSSHNETVKSVSLMVTMAGAADAKNHSAHPGILKLFKEAGFRTYWISNQNDWGASAIRVHMNEADSIHCSMGAKGVTDEIDGNLLPIIQDALNGNQDKFLVIHLTGNHWSYEKRYPKEFSKFGIPDTENAPSYFDKSRKQELIDIYDNSVLYQDYIIHQIISLLNKTKSAGTVLYLPDHGENLFDDCRELTGHGTAFTSASYRIPLFIYYSNEYKECYPEKVNALSMNKTKPFITGDNLFQSVADAAGIKFNKFNMQRSVLSYDFVPEKERKILLPNLTVSSYESEFNKESKEVKRICGKK